MSGIAGSAPPSLPERTDGPLDPHGLTLARWRTQDAATLHALILANIEHLRPFMGWAAGEPRTLAQHTDLLAGWTREWRAGTSVVMGVWRDGQAVGSTGLHRRGPGDQLDIGYWVDHRHLRQGIATTVTRALVGLAFTVDGVERVVVTHDVSNLASAAVPTRLGFRRHADRHAPEVLGEAGTGWEGVWSITRAQWADRDDRAAP